MGEGMKNSGYSAPLTAAKERRGAPGAQWRVVALCAVLAIATCVSYLLWLGWHSPYITSASLEESGPYESWQVIGVTASAIVFAVVGSAFGGGKTPALTVAAAFTLTWSADQASRAENESLWLVGAILLSAGSIPIAILIAHLTQRTRAWLSSKAGPL